MTFSEFTTRPSKPHFAAYYRWLILTRHLRLQVEADAMLDVGCDDGYFLRCQSGPFKVGVDLSPRLLPSPGLAVVQADGCALPFAEGCFAAVFAFDIIEHVPDDAAFIASAVRVLAPGGCLWLSTPSETARLFPGWLMRRAMKGWGHQRVGYDADELVGRFPPGYSVHVFLWNTASFGLFYVLLRLLRALSPALARLGARLCFEIDRRLPNGRDHIFIKIVREGG